MVGLAMLDLRHALRSLLKRPGFTLAALLTLTLGIGANSAVFSMVNGVLLRPLPFGERTERIVTLHSTHPSQPEDWEDSRLSYRELQDVRAGSRSLEDAAGYVGRSVTLLAGAGAEPERLRGGSVTPNLFPLLGVHPAIGRHFKEEEAQAPGFEPVVMLSHRLWQQRFGGDAGIVGRSVTLNGRALSVIGVMPAGMRFPERDELWLPFRHQGEPTRTLRNVALFGLLKRGASLEQAQQELSGLAARLAREYPDSNRDWGIRVLSFRDFAVRRGTRVVLGSLLGAVLAVLLIGCANLANLILVRGVARQRELAVRSALGASRGRLVRQLLLESGLLAAAGSALGLTLGAWAVELAQLSWPEELPYWIRFDLDWRVVGFTAVLAALSTLVAGLLPALRASRPDLVVELRDGARSSPSLVQQRVQAGLVVGQVALSLALLVGANLMIRSFLRLAAADSGFREESLLSLRINISGDQYDDARVRARFVRTLLERLEAQPGIERAAATNSVPTDDGGIPVRIVADAQPVAPGQEPGAQMILAAPSLFATLGAPLVEGRGFDDSEHETPDAHVAIVNRALARRFYPDGALGRRIGVKQGAETRSLRIVGVAPDLQYEEFGEETAQSRLNVFVPYAFVPQRGLALLVRTRTPPRLQAEAVRRALRELDPGLAAWDVRTMAEVRAFTTWDQRFFGKLMGAFAAVALLLACLGIYGVLAYAVSRRSREIGVRLALGARPEDVHRMVLGRAGALAAAGVGLGLVLSLAVGRLLQSVLYGVSGGDPAAFAGMAALLAAVVLLASWLPARRAAAVDPIAALRAE
jgi:predicted permease